MQEAKVLCSLLSCFQGLYPRLRQSSGSSCNLDAEIDCRSAWGYELLWVMREDRLKPMGCRCFQKGHAHAFIYMPYRDIWAQSSGAKRDCVNQPEGVVDAGSPGADWETLTASYDMDLSRVATEVQQWCRWVSKRLRSSRTPPRTLFN
ncbi:uncharacterized protein K460DRAFT_185689 [Cucurbitaria berberidis CBS 394.84]|uniref:Uncharacterized protein n=1 Tax=Cucurbitaria berberidis CBS 394.84 TaxID=1168544 RepID=A0A9P4GBB7_9PLEO|nr:uncharacterized protein K460DRAFT_185689 [Cucurbitaria berberidis CBS 394.84]KAF1842462.1 hypothetical protein K460DRAFT_185689 [Cucurbitaria berberidis CBS 394.84]